MLDLIRFVCSKPGSGEENVFITIKSGILHLLYFFVDYFP